MGGEDVELYDWTETIYDYYRRVAGENTDHVASELRVL